MKKTILPLIAIASAAVLTASCRTGGGAYPAQNATKYDVENNASFVAMDSGAQQSVTASAIQERMTPDGRLEVAANMRNRLNRRIEVQVNCEFKDPQGFAIDSTPWQTLILTENAQETVRFAALNSQAKRYTIRVREAR